MNLAYLLASAAAIPSVQAETDTRHDIVVTGERISRSTHETASSVAVHDKRQLANEAAPDRIEQVLQSIPNLQLGSGGEGPTIRGQDSTGVVRDLPAFLSGTRPRTTITIDGRSATYYELAFGLTSVWDVERVEVFRSPQTTTQGRNSIAGAIFVETTAPEFDWEGAFRLVIGESTTQHASAVISGPLIDEQLAMRISGDVRRSQTASRITNAAIGIDPNRDDSETIRLKLLAQPAALPDTQLSVIYSHVHSQMPQVEGIEAPYEARRNPNATYGIFAVSVDSLTGRLSYQPSGEFEARTTVSYGTAGVRRNAPQGFGVADIDTKDFSLEPVILWRSGTGTTLTAGSNYTRALLDQTIDLAAFPLVLGSGAFSDTQDSFGLFGEGSLPLTSTVTLNLGLRYQHDRQVRRGVLAGNAINLPLDYDRTFTAWLPKFALDWDISPELRVGVLAQRAFNPGGVNLNANRARIEAFGAERLWDFEIYTRARLAGGRFELSANIFHYALRDTQRTQIVEVLLPGGLVASTAQVDNAPRAWSRGLELDANWKLSADLSVKAAVGLLDTRITRTILLSDPMLGKQFQRSPHFSGSASVAWSPIKSLLVSAQIRSNSSYFSDDLETASRKINGSTTLDAKIAWTKGGLTVFGYARNMFDEFHLTYEFGFPTWLATAGDPRELGIGMESRF